MAHNKLSPYKRLHHPSTARVFDFVERYIKEQQYPPTLREICMGCGIASVSTVRHHLRILQDWNILEVVDGSPRAIRIIRRKR